MAVDRCKPLRGRGLSSGLGHCLNAARREHYCRPSALDQQSDLAMLRIEHADLAGIELEPALRQAADQRVDTFSHGITIRRPQVGEHAALEFTL